MLRMDTLMYLKKAQPPAPQLVYAVRRPVPATNWRPAPMKAEVSPLAIDEVNQSLDVDAAYWEFLARVDDYTRRQLDQS